MKVALYMRVSTDDQTNENQSVRLREIVTQRVVILPLIVSFVVIVGIPMNRTYAQINEAGDRARYRISQG